VSKLTLRLALVIVLGLWALGTTLPSINALSHPPGTFGFRADYDGLAAGAAGAYDQLEIESLRRRLRELETRLAEA